MIRGILGLDSEVNNTFDLLSICIRGLIVRMKLFARMNESIEQAPTSNSLRHYYIFWAGQQISSAGSAIVSFAIIWWLTVTTGSALVLALSSALSFGTMMVVQFFSGYLTDYSNRKFLLFLVDLAQAVATTCLLYLFLTSQESVITILVILGIRGLFDGLHAPAKGAILPTMVPQSELKKVNSISSSARSVINLFSPAVAALLVSMYTQKLWIVLLLDPLTFLVALLPLLIIHIPDIRKEHSPVESLLSKISGGFRYLKHSTGLVPLLFIFASFNFFITPVSMLSPLIILSDRGFGSTEFIFALSIMLSNLSFLLMSLLLTKFTPAIRETTGIIIGFIIALCGLMLIWLSLSFNKLPLYLLGNTVIGFGFPIVNVYSSIIWQSQVPNTHQGRIISVRMLITTASLPLVMIFTGFVADVLSFASLFFAAILGFSTILSVIVLFTDFKLIDSQSAANNMTTKEISKPADIVVAD